MVKVIMNGYLGQMGMCIVGLAGRRTDIEIVAGADAAVSHSAAPFPTFADIADCDMPADVIIDFSNADAVDTVLDYAVKKRVPAVICTTGLTSATESKITEAAKSLAVFKSANMSLGVNLVANVLQRVAGLLYDEGFDIEILEKHHNRKTDAPSGTALLLADSVNSATKGKLKYIYDRTGEREKRRHNELGIHALRGGTIVGYHSVIFAGLNETIEFTHEAFSKEVFATGALKAAKFMKGKPPGLYTMKDVMDEL